MYRRFFVCTMLVWSLSLLSCSSHDSNSEEDASSSVTANADPTRFGLFIGINEYADDNISDLSGCVRDATGLRDIFVKRFGFQEVAFLTNANATREGIAAGFRKLVDQVETLRNQERIENKSDQPILVVVTYSGHGYFVKNQNPREDPEENGWDETWCPHDTSSTNGNKEIRDDDIYLVWHKLTHEFNATVLLISDSCHSGSIHRGMFAQARSRWTRSSEVFDGPSQELFPDYASSRQGQNDEGTNLLGFVKYSACLDSESAWEDQGGGRFTLSLCEVLPEIGPEVTYEEIHERVAKVLRERWPYGPAQHPQFSANAKDRYFLSGERAIGHATVVPRSIMPGTATLTMGSIDGVAKGSRFEFFSNVSDLVQRRNAFGFGIVSEVTPFTCHVEFDDTVKIDYSSKARLDRVRLYDFKVKVMGTVPSAVIQAIQKLDSDKAIILVKEDAVDYSVLVQPIPDEEDTLGIYFPWDEPGFSSDGSVPQTVRKIHSEDTDQLAKLVANNLLYLGRVIRLTSLDYAGDQLITDVIAYRWNSQGQLEAIHPPREEIDGVRRLKNQDLFSIIVKNSLRDRQYLTVLFMKDNGDLTVLFPEPGEPGDIAVQPGTQIEIGRVGGIDHVFRARLNDDEDYDRMFVKVIATNRQIDFRPLSIPPETGMRGRFPINRDPLYDLIADALHGGLAKSRGDIGRVVRPETWAVKSIFVDVER